MERFIQIHAPDFQAELKGTQALHHLRELLNRLLLDQAKPIVIDALFYLRTEAGRTCKLQGLDGKKWAQT